MSRLELLYNDSLDEVGKLKSEYEAKLIEANDKFRNTKVENEQLKEKVDVLFKLGRSYLNRKESREHGAMKEPPSNHEDEIETISIEDVTVEEASVEEVTDEDLQSWTKNKLRGFKRAGPASKPEKKNEANPAIKSSPTTTTTTTKPTAAGMEATPAQQPNGMENNVPLRYCHFYVNKGKCNFEERTGQKCRFEHKIAPMCNLGLNCTRLKCMYSHPKVNGVNSFLGNTRGMNQMMNPWNLGQMMNPWMTTPSNQFMPNPWNFQGRQDQNQSRQ